MKNYRILQSGILQKFLIIAFLFIASKSTLSDAGSTRYGSQADYYPPLPQAVEDNYSVSHTPYLVYMGSWDYTEKASRADNILLAEADLSTPPVYESTVTNAYLVSYTTDSKTETYRELSETSEPVYLTDLSAPQVTSETTIGVAPYGYIAYNQPVTVKHPIRDFRADYWQNKYYRDEFHNAASYQETYIYNNIFNESVSSGGSED